MQYINIAVLAILVSINILVLKKFYTFKKPIISQSDVFHMIKDFLPRELFEKRVTNTQSFEYERKTNVRVVILGDTAYWVKDNKVFMADMNDGVLDGESVQEVDMMGMDQVQLDKMLFIMDQLAEGK